MNRKDFFRKSQTNKTRQCFVYYPQFLNQIPRQLFEYKNSLKKKKKKNKT